MKDENGIEYFLADFIADAKVSPKKIIIFGAGEFGNYVYSRLIEQGIDILGFCDNKKAGQVKFGKKIYSVDELKENKNAYVVVSVMNAHQKMSIKEQLLNCGIDKNRLVVPLSLKGDPFYKADIHVEPELQEIYLRICCENANASNRVYRYFSSNGLKKLLVYPYKDYEDFLRNELNGSDIRIVGEIVCRDNLPKKDQYDAIIVLDEGHFEKIEDEFLPCTDKPIISLLEVIG